MVAGVVTLVVIGIVVGAGVVVGAATVVVPPAYAARSVVVVGAILNENIAAAAMATNDIVRRSTNFNLCSTFTNTKYENDLTIAHIF